MIIAHCIYSLTTGGSESLLVDIVNRQALLGHEVYLLIINDRIDPVLLSAVSPAVHTVRIGRRPGSRSPLPFVRFFRALRRIKPDIVHSHSASLLPLLIGLKKRLVFTIHCLGISPRWFGRCGALVAISNEVAAQYDASRFNLSVIPNGVDFQAIKVRSARRPAAGSPLKIVNVGRLVAATKSQDVLICAAARLKSEGCDVRVTFIGDGESAGSLKSLAAELGVSDSIEFVGKQPRSFIYAHLADYDMMCHPARNEGFGLTVAEGMGAALPVVVADQGGPAEVVDYGRFGAMFHTGSVDGCAAAIRKIAENYPSEADIARAREHVLAQYSVGHMVDQYLQLYARLTSCGA